MPSKNARTRVRKADVLYHPVDRHTAMSHIKVKPVLLVLPVFVAAVEAFRFLEVVGQSPTAISVLKSTRGTSVTKCGIMCVQHPFCSSFGFIPGPKQCDLSSLTFEDRSDLSLFDVKQDGRAFYGSSKDAGSTFTTQPLATPVSAGPLVTTTAGPLVTTTVPLVTTITATVTTSSAPLVMTTSVPVATVLWEKPGVVQTTSASCCFYQLMFADVQISFQEGDVIYAEYEVTSTPPNNLNAGMEILSAGSLDSKFAHSGGMVFDPPFFRTDWLFPNPTNFYVTATCQATGFLFEIKDSAQTLVYTHTTGHRVAGATCATIEGVQFTNGKADHLFCRTLKILRP